MRGAKSTAQHYGGECSLLYKKSNITSDQTSHSFVGFAVPLDLHMVIGFTFCQFNHM